jgi:L-fuculose-phosphate aldolase
MLHDAGWIANHDGNVSLKEGSRVLITPTAVSKRLCTAETIVECDLDGKPIGRGKPPSEIALHLGAYRAREEIAAVVHAHPPYVSAFALVGRTIDPIAMPEVLVSLGDRVPLVPMFVPKDAGAADAVREALAGADVAIMAGNGAIAVGPDLETAYLRLEVLEHYARILAIARGGVGEPAALPEAAQKKCLELRKAAGLHRDPPRGSGMSDTRRVVMEEVRRALGEKK